MTTQTQINITVGAQGPRWWVLVHTKHGRTALDTWQNNSGLPRMLNATGRWSAHPTEQVPVLVWDCREDAEAAADTARRTKGREVVQAQQIGGTGLEVGRNLRRFTPVDAPALVGYRDYGPTARKKGEDARLKVLAYAARLVGESTSNDQLIARAKELASRSGSGGADHLTGRAGGALARAIVNGEVEADDLVTNDVVAKALLIAHTIVEARLDPHQPVLTGEFGRR